jgi:hypothetical protein
MYLGEPGLQFIITYFTVLIGTILTIGALLTIRKSKFHLVLTLVILIITILTGMPLWLEDYLSSGHKMKQVGLIFYGIGIPIQIVLLIIAIIERKRINKKSNI